MSYIQFLTDIIHIVGLFVFGLFAAVTESVIALSLLFKKGLGFLLPIGFNGNRGDILGTTVIYCFIFLYLMVMYPPFGLWKT